MTRPLLILGSAACLFDDLAALGPFDGEVMAVNESGAFVGGAIDHWASLHPERFGGWLAERARRGGNTDCTTWSFTAAPGVDRQEPKVERSGSSGLFAVRLALHVLGCPRVVLAGMPLDDSRHVTDGPRRSGPSFVPYRPEWRQAARGEFEGRVRALSGWTAGVLGRPTVSWLAGGAA